MLALFQARAYGLAGSIAQSIAFVVRFAIMLMQPGQVGQAASSNQITLSDLLFGLLGLVYLLGILGAMESISKSFSERSVIDSYVLFQALISATYGLSLLGFATPALNLWPLGQGGAWLTGGISMLGYAFFLGTLSAQFLYLFCLYRVYQALGDRLFIVAGIISVAGTLPRILVGSYLFEFSPLFLVAAFFTMRTHDIPKKPAVSWGDIPKGIVRNYSLLWFTDEAIFRVRPVLASMTGGAFACLLAPSLVGQFFFQHYDVNGNLSPLTSGERGLEGLAGFVLVAVFVVLSRYRYPKFAPQEVTKRAIERFSWEEVTRLDATRGKVTLVARNEEYTIGMGPSDLKALDNLTQRKLGRSTSPDRKDTST